MMDHRETLGRGQFVRDRLRLLALAAGWLILTYALLAAGGAAAASYRVLEGALTNLQSGLVQPLSGTLQGEICDLCYPDNDVQHVLQIDSFQLQAGSDIFEPVGSSEIADLAALRLHRASGILLSEDQVLFMLLNAGGVPVAADEMSMTFRFFEFVSTPSDDSWVSGGEGDGSLPGRLNLNGSMIGYDELYQRRTVCSTDPSDMIVLPGFEGSVEIELAPDLSLPSDGAILSITDRPSAVVFEVDQGGRLDVGSVVGSTGTVARFRGGARLVGGAAPWSARPALRGRMPVVEIPSLVDLGVSAPNGAEVTFDDSGILTVTTDGNLYVLGTAIEILGLTHLVLNAAGDILVEGDLSVPSGVDVSLSGSNVQIGEGTTIVTDGNLFLDAALIHTFPDFNLDAGTLFFRPESSSSIDAGADLVITTRPGGLTVPFIYGENIECDAACSQIEMVEPGLIALDWSDTFSLADLGITAPDGAEVSLNDSGVLTVASDGSVYLEEASVDIAWLTGLVIRAVNIVVRGDLGLPPDLELTLDASDSLILTDGESEGVDEPPMVDLEACRSYWTRVSQSERDELARFSLVAARIQEVGIDVLPGKKRNRVRPGRDRRIPVALLGSEALDVRDVDRSSLKFGPGSASIISGRTRAGLRNRDINRDGYLDLVMGFELRNTGIASGDREACLVGELFDGTVVSGCDAIKTRRGVRPGSVR